MAPSIGVVIPALDEAEHLPGLVELLLDPGAGSAVQRVVVADGGSSDGTVDLARAAGAQVVSAPRGRGRQLAAGAARLDTDLLWFLHADCRPEPGCVEALRAAFRDPALVAAGCAQRIDSKGRFFRLVEGAADRRVKRGMVFGDSALCVRRGSYEAVGGFAEVSLFEDVDLSERLIRAGLRPRLVSAARVSISARRWEREGRLRTTLRNWMLRFAYRMGADPEQLVRRYAPHGEGAAAPEARGDPAP